MHVRMKILIVSVDFTPHCDGVSSLSSQYARRLAERGHDVMAVAPRAPGARAEDAVAPYQVFRFPGYALGLPRFVPFALWSLAALFRHRPDVVFAMNIGYGGVLCWGLSRMARCRYVTMAYAYEFLKFRTNPLLRRLYLDVYRRSLFTVAISRFTERRLVEFGVPSAQIRVSYPGAAVIPAEPMGEEERLRASGARRPPSIGACGRIIRRKGHDLVIRALPRLVVSFPDLQYRICGSGPQEAELRALAGRLGVSEHVQFVGCLGRNELAAFYRKIDVFVMPSRDEESSGHVEGFGIVYLEAAMYSVPSIGTRTGGIPEAILDGETGVLVDPESLDQLTDALLALLSDDKQRARMGAAARARALREFTWDRQIDLVHEWLTEAQGATGVAPTYESQAKGEPSAGLRVVVLTRTGRGSGLSIARAIRENRRHVLVGVLAERRTTMLKTILRRGSLRGFIRKYTLGLIVSRLCQLVRAAGGTVRRAWRGPAPGDPEFRLPMRVVRSLNSEDARDILDAWRADVLVVANAPLLKPDTYGKSRLGAVNFHSGRLPEYGGVASEFWAQYDGQREAWATIHRVEARLDSGAILAESPIPIGPADDPESLHTRCVQSAGGLVIEVLNRLAEGQAEPVRDPGPAILRPWPSARQRRELSRRLRSRRR